jgi:aerobic carbon-monoxide dehydrogenase medium subunit
MKAAPFDYHAARTVDEAVALLSEYADQDGRVIAGGQSFVPMMAFRLARPGHLIDINGVAELDRLAAEDGVLKIGAMVRHAALETMKTGGVLGRLLSKVAHSIAHKPIRNRGTFCGSIVNADPAAEWCLAAVTLDAEVVARSVRAVRVLPAVGFFMGAMMTELAADELVIECRIPLLADAARFGFDEVSRRVGDFAMAAALATYRLEDGRVVDPRIGIGGVEQCPRRISEAEAMIAGAHPDAGAFRAAAAAAADAVEPMDDGQTGLDYRRQLTRAVVERALERTLS